MLASYEDHVEKAITYRDNLKKGERGFGARSYELPELPIQYDKRADAELQTLGVKLSCPDAHIQAPNALSYDTWLYLRSSIDACPGSSRVRISFGPWTLDTGLTVNRDMLAKHLVPIGCRME
jgi:hypothetical protein